MKETIDNLNKKSWGMMQSIGLMGGILFFLFTILNISRWINRGDYNIIDVDTFGWPEYLFIGLISCVIIVFVLLTINKVPVWLWIEKIKDKFKKEEGDENEGA